MKTKTWALLIGAILLISAAAAVFLLQKPAESLRVQILQRGELVEEIDLSTVKEPYSITMTDPKNGGVNRILVEPGRISIAEADCPDQICVQHGWLPDSAAPIVCLPNGLVIQLADEGAFDSVAQ